MSAVTDAEVDVTELRRQVADLRAALAHAHGIAAAERARADRAEQTGRDAWRVAVRTGLWPVDRRGPAPVTAAPPLNIRHLRRGRRAATRG